MQSPTDPSSGRGGNLQHKAMPACRERQTETWPLIQLAPGLFLASHSIHGRIAPTRALVRSCARVLVCSGMLWHALALACAAGVGSGRPANRSQVDVLRRVTMCHSLSHSAQSPASSLWLASGDSSPRFGGNKTSSCGPSGSKQK